MYTSFEYTYDSNGNISSITEKNGNETRTKSYVYDSLNNGMSFVWEHGRKLSKTVLSDGTEVSYTYNTDGIRIRKTVGNVSTEYFTDSSGVIHALKQGDVIGMVAEDLTLVVSYEYNSWGKTIDVSGSLSKTLGNLNPFRYRGYVYDAETGFWLL